MKIRYIIFIAIIFISCVTADDKEEQYFNQEIMKITFNTTGGGDLKFSITPVAGAYQISVERYDFNGSDMKILLSERDNSEVFRLVDKIFTRQTNLHNEVYKPQGLTGSWTTVTITSETDETSEISNISPSKNLRPLYDYIELKIK